MKKIAFILATVISANSFGQDIEIIKPKGGFKEIDLTTPSFTVSPDPIPKSNGVFKTTHLMVCSCVGDGGGVIHQYINQTNGVVGIPKKLLKKWDSDGGKMEDAEAMDYWAIMPNKTQIHFVNSPEHGKIVMEMTTGDGNYTNTMARFDNYMQGEIFWRNAKKIRTIDIPKGDFVTNKSMSAKAFTADVYEFNSEEGKMNVILKDLGEAKGNYTTLKTNYAAVGMGGLGWIYRKQNNHVYLVYQISNKANTLGCMLAALIPEKFSFSGAGYKPMGDIMLEKIKENQQQENNSIEDGLAEKLRDEKDLQLIALYKEKAKIEQDFYTKVMESNANAALLNDASEITRSTADFATNPEMIYKMADIELRIKAREIEIELSENQDPTLRARLNKDLNCNRKQQTLWMNYRIDAKKLKEKMKGLEQFEQMEKMGVLMADYQQRLLTLCQ